MGLTATLMRYSYQEKQTLGYLTFDNATDDRFYMLELPWKQNQHKVSCIPEGLYKVIPRTSDRFGRHFKVVSIGYNEVIGRSGILQHPGNYHKDIEGCQLPGMGMADLNKDGLHDITGSKIALARMLEIAPQGYELLITSPFTIE